MIVAMIIKISFDNERKSSQSFTEPVAQPCVYRALVQYATERKK